MPTSNQQTSELVDILLRYLSKREALDMLLEMEQTGGNASVRETWARLRKELEKREH